MSLPLHQLLLPRTIPKSAGAPPEVQFCAMVAPAVRTKVRAAAKARLWHEHAAAAADTPTTASEEASAARKSRGGDA